MKRRAIVCAILLCIVGYGTAGCKTASSKGCCGDSGQQTTERQAAPDTPVNLVSLQDSLSPLRERFNANNHKLQAVALLSPT